MRTDEAITVMDLHENLKAEIVSLRAALNLFVVYCTYPVSTEINRRGYSWRDERALDYAFDEAIKALGANEQTTEKSK